MDAFQHINNTVYFRYFEDARLAYFEKTGVMEHMNQTNIGPILAETQCQFRAPIAYPDQVLIGTRLKEIPLQGDSRFIMEYAIYSDQHDTIAAKGTGNVVYYNYEQGSSCEIPANLIAVFKQLQTKHQH
jgi:acyl-CoA thioester hydrolase